jgi:hypothetical protein
MERRQYTREFKLEAVRLIKERGVSYAQASEDLGVHPTQLRNWVKQLADLCRPRWQQPSAAWSGLGSRRNPSDTPHEQEDVMWVGAGITLVIVGVIVCAFVLSRD